MYCKHCGIEIDKDSAFSDIVESFRVLSVIQKVCLKNPCLQLEWPIKCKITRLSWKNVKMSMVSKS